MDTRNLGFLGLGLLLAIVVVSLVGVAPEVWIPLILVAGLVGLAVIRARAAGSDIAERVAGRAAENGASSAEPRGSATVSATARPSGDLRPVDVALVREADDGKPAVWLHRCGGRRVHRFASDVGWTVEQVSTKDPDDPRKRVIGEPLTFEREADALAAADDMARGLRPGTAAAGLERPAPVAT